MLNLSILDGLKNFNNIEIIIILVVIIIIAIIINSRIFRILLTSIFLLIIFLTFSGKFQTNGQTLDNLIQIIKEKTGIIKETLKEDEHILLTINDIEYDAIVSKETNIPDQVVLSILEDVLVSVGDLVYFEQNGKEYQYEVIKIATNSSDDDLKYNLVINSQQIIYGNLKENQ